MFLKPPKICAMCIRISLYVHNNSKSILSNANITHTFAENVYTLLHKTHIYTTHYTFLSVFLCIKSFKVTYLIENICCVQSNCYFFHYWESNLVLFSISLQTGGIAVNCCFPIMLSQYWTLLFAPHIVITIAIVVAKRLNLSLSPKARKSDNYCCHNFLKSDNFMGRNIWTTW